MAMSTPNPSVRRAGVPYRGMHLGELAREQAVAAHREEDARLAVHDDEHDAGDGDECAGGEQGSSPRDAGTLAFNAAASGASLPVSVLMGATPTAAIATRT